MKTFKEFANAQLDESTVEGIHPEVVKAYNDWREYNKKNVNNTGPYQGHVIKKYKKFVATSEKHGLDPNAVHQTITRHELKSNV